MSRGVPRSSGDTYNRAYQGLMLPEGWCCFLLWLFSAVPLVFSLKTSRGRSYFPASGLSPKAHLGRPPI